MNSISLENEVKYSYKNTKKEITEEERDRLYKKKYSKRLEELKHKIYSGDNSNYTMDELLEYRELIRKPFNRKKIKMDFSINEESYFTMKDVSEITGQISEQTKSFLWDVTHRITHEGFLIYKNNKPIRGITDLCKELGISKYKWSNNIKPYIDKFNIIKKVKIEGSWFIVLNPIFAMKSRKITTHLFIVFHEEIRDYISDLDYITMCKIHQIKL